MSKRGLILASALLCLVAVVEVTPNGARAAPAPAGVVVGWGSGSSGELGTANSSSSHFAVALRNLGTVTTLTGGNSHVVALRPDGSVWTWGTNDHGQLGNGTTSDSAVPGPVPGVSGATAVGAGFLHSMAVIAGGTVAAWGDNSHGQLGNGTTSSSSTAVVVPGLTGVTAVSAGTYHSLALRSDGTVWSWGWNFSGQLGNGTTDSSTPVEVTGLDQVTAVAAGDDFSLALRADGTVWGWGDRGQAILGYPASGNSRIPVQVPNLTAVTAIAADQGHAVAARSDGTVWAWGANQYGQAGTGTPSTSDCYCAPPAQVAGLSGVTAVAAGALHSLALRDDGTVWAWGADFEEQLGTPPLYVGNCYSCSATPVQASTVQSATGIGAGGAVSFAITPGPAAIAQPLKASYPDTAQGSQSSPQTITVRSAGTAALTVSNVEVAGPNPQDFAVVADACTAHAIDPGTSCDLQVVFAPRASGARTATLIITDDVPGAVPSQSVELSGNGTPAVRGRYVPMTPARLADTRPGSGNAYAGQTLRDQSTLGIQVTGVQGVPAANVSSVYLNLTATNATASSFLTAYPSGQPRPTASNLNFDPGETHPNLVHVPVGPDGKVSIFNNGGSVDVVVDVEGYVTTVGSEGALFNALGPARLVDTRPGSGYQAAGAPLHDRQVMTFRVTGQGGVPSSGVGAVALNVTATGPTAGSFLTVFPAGQTRPTASNLNFRTGETVPNRVVVPVGSDGQVSLYNNQGLVDVVVDVNGWFTSGTAVSPQGATMHPLDPGRVYDSRARSGMPGAGNTPVGGSVTRVQVAGPGGVQAMGTPGAPDAVVLNVTATNPTTASFFTVYPHGVARPDASDLNWVPGLTVPNLVVAKVGSDGGVDIYNNAGRVDVVVDVLGYYGP